MRARSVASRKLLGCSSPVKTQLFIQTRAISSYSSLRAGRMVGGAIQSVPDGNVAVFGAKKKPRDDIARASSTQPNAEDHSAACGPCGIFCCRAASAALARIMWSLPQRSRDVEAIKVHHLGPRLDEVIRKLLLGVRASIDFRDGTELGMRPEDQIDACAGPLHRLRLAVAALVFAIGASWLPLRAHVEEVDEEVVRQCFRLLGEDAVLQVA